MSSIIFGSARIDENNKTTGGSAGDQTGNEVSTQTYYTHSKGWYGFIPKSNDVAEKLATAMQQACDNNHIGYDQNQRDSLLTQYKKYGSIKAITTNCECDCSSLVRVCIYQATGTLLNDFNTESEPSALASSGLFEDKISVSSSSQCTLGMILCTKSKGHTGIICSGASLGGTTSSGTTSSSSKLTVDGQIGPKTVSRIQKFCGLSQDGYIDGQSSSQKKYWTSILSSVCGWTGGYSATVRAWQKYLYDKGYGIGSNFKDGELGPNTAKASQNFLKDKGFYTGSIDSIFGSASAKALQSWLNTK
ncbi:MAG: hypothetical protein LIP02_13745 [Bacteroidales bacterium]|nr:hypothetical protein [Bacteroidales bacterium]MCC8177385.1 hypothetical protein [Bacteroidales bacterium]